MYLRPAHGAAIAPDVTFGAMARRFKKQGNRRRTFIAAWRARRYPSQEDFAHDLGIAPSTLSRIEAGLLPYGQDFLETCAEKLDCSPADLLARDPTDPEGIWTAWDAIPPAERPRALAMLRVFTAEPPRPPQEEPRPRKRGRG